MKNRINTFSYLSFILPVIVLLIACFLFYSSYEKSKNYIECEAKIIDFRIEEDKTYVNKDNRFKIIPTVEYYINGALYTNESRFYSSNMKKGETIKILCNPDDPSDFISRTGLYLIPIVIAGIGFVLLLFSFIFKVIFNNLLIRISNSRI